MCSRRRRREPTRSWRTPPRGPTRPPSDDASTPRANRSPGRGCPAPHAPTAGRIISRDASSLASNVAAVAEDTSRRPRDPLPWTVPPSRAPYARERGRAPPQCPEGRGSSHKSTRRVASARAPATGGKCARASSRVAIGSTTKFVVRRVVARENNARLVRPFPPQGDTATPRRARARVIRDAPSSAGARHVTSQYTSDAFHR